jgi:hypothetical protein
MYPFILKKIKTNIIKLLFKKYFYCKNYFFFKNFWGLGVGVWGMGVGALGPIPNPQL